MKNTAAVINREAVHKNDDLSGKWQNPSGYQHC
jgi:hypothetical protein